MTDLPSLSPVGDIPRIEHWRLRAGFTRREVEHILLLARGEVAGYETGKYLPSRDMARRLALLYQDTEITADAILAAVGRVMGGMDRRRRKANHD